MSIAFGSATIPYNVAIGSLMYAMISTRPDIAFAVGLVSRHQQHPTLADHNAVRRIFKYIDSTSSTDIQYFSNQNNELVSHCDAEWAADNSDRKSTHGFVFLFGSGPVSWMSKKQTSISTSSTESEYIAIADAVREALWFRRLLSDLGLPPKRPTTIYCDNQAAINLVNNPVHHARMKHIDVSLHFVRDHQDHGNGTRSVSVIYCPTDIMIADICTKSLPLARHLKLWSLMNLKLPTLSS